ncbi:hypothetical protein SADUNF_Sadunf04G0159900 [Salix dunnii]|uniref:Uncharacterized protein n=1 Tax=Salix dunnii TaxID=1413687 RepID=A0A835KC39_9ROSI|nr:hypothetical protein SADUNF_Sadunf04G0159900 [Salix dunnii]
MRTPGTLRNRRAEVGVIAIRATKLEVSADANQDHWITSSLELASSSSYFALSIEARTEQIQTSFSFQKTASDNSPYQPPSSLGVHQRLVYQAFDPTTPFALQHHFLPLSLSQTLQAEHGIYYSILGKFLSFSSFADNVLKTSDFAALPIFLNCSASELSRWSSLEISTGLSEPPSSSRDDIFEEFVVNLSRVFSSETLSFSNFLLSSSTDVRVSARSLVVLERFNLACLSSSKIKPGAEEGNGLKPPIKF